MSQLENTLLSASISLPFFVGMTASNSQSRVVLPLLDTHFPD